MTHILKNIYFWIVLMTAVMIFPAYAQQKEDNPGQITNGKRTYEIMPELTVIDAQTSVKSLNGQKNPVGNIGSLNIYKKTDVPPTDTDSISGGLTASGADSVRPNKIKPHFVVKNTQTGTYGVSYGDIQINMHDGQSIQYVLKEYPVSLSYGFQGNTSFGIVRVNELKNLTSVAEKLKNDPRVRSVFYHIEENRMKPR